MISKYPPIEGGVSSRVYWLARALGERGHEVHVITNSLEVESEYREELSPNDPDFKPKNVYVHSSDPSPTIEANPSHIPFSKMYCEKLASKAIEVVEEYDLDLIDSRYLVPYVVAGYLAKSLVGIPQIVGHAGSDLQRQYPSPYLNKLLVKVLKNADRIVTNQETATFFSNLGVPASRISLMPQMYVDTRAFNPDVSPFNFEGAEANQKYSPGIPIIAYIGKITCHFETKGLPALLRACSKINGEFVLLFVANGNKIGDLKALAKREHLADKTLFKPFLPPWKMPSILKSCTCVVALENSSSPVLGYHIPSIPGEAIAVGRCVLMSNEVHAKEPFKKLENGKEVLAVNTKDASQIKEILEKLIKDPTIAERIGTNSRSCIGQVFSMAEYVEKTVQIYGSVVNS